MIYTDKNLIRIQKSNLRYFILGEGFFLKHKTKRQMYLDFTNNKPIGPTILVEWEDE